MWEVVGLDSAHGRAMGGFKSLPDILQLLDFFHLSEVLPWRVHMVTGYHLGWMSNIAMFCHNWFNAAVDHSCDKTLMIMKHEH
jgi:hypothetical protein